MSTTKTMPGVMSRELRMTFRNTTSKLKKTMTKRTTRKSSSTMSPKISNSKGRINQPSLIGISETMLQVRLTISTTNMTEILTMNELRLDRIISSRDHPLSSKCRKMTLTKGKLEATTPMVEEIQTKSNLLTNPKNRVNITKIFKDKNSHKSPRT